MRMRRRLPWLLAVPLMVAGSVAAHSLTYLVVAARTAPEGDAEASERVSSAHSGYLVLFMGVLAATALVAAAARSPAGRHRRGGLEPYPWMFFLLPPLAFGLQELSERALHAEAFPFHAALEPRFLLGLLLQVPFALLALFLGRAFLRVVE